MKSRGGQTVAKGLSTSPFLSSIFVLLDENRSKLMELYAN
jgi:hypothetical protein